MLPVGRRASIIIWEVTSLFFIFRALCDGYCVVYREGRCTSICVSGLVLYVVRRYIYGLGVLQLSKFCCILYQASIPYLNRLVR